MSPPRASPGERRRLVGVVGYYAVLAAALALLVRYMPGAAEAFTGGRLQRLSASDAFGSGALPVGGPISATPWAGALLGGVSMLGALAVMLPVTWIYMVTRARRGYDEAVVHTLLVLPIAVTGIIIVVQHNVALAFSLAGIVAAVRFRTTLDDTKDAVYIFLAIGVGITAGVQWLGLALTISVIFNIVILVIWLTRFGNAYADRGTGPGGLGLADALAGPASATDARIIGSAALLEAAAPKDMAEVLERAARMERHISEERSKKKSRRANTLLLVHTREAGPAQAFVESALEELSVRWKLAEAGHSPGGRVILQYLARLEQTGAEGALLDRLGGAAAGVVEAAELRSLRGLRARA